MFETQCRIVLIRVIPLLALILLAGCATTKDVANRADAAKKVKNIPLLVHFDARGCPTEVTKVFEVCDPDELPDDVPFGPDLVCREKGKWITWLAVTDGSPPDLSNSEFTIEFTEGDVPIDSQCKESKDGVLECKVKTDAHGKSKYTVTPKSGRCVLDPRFYVG